MKKILLTIVAFMMLFAVCMAQTTDTLEYKQVSIQVMPMKDVYYICKEDNDDGTIVRYDGTGKSVEIKFSSRMQALKTYTSKGWQVINVYPFDNMVTIYLLKRKKQ